jgi:hypothetical protein
MLAEIEAMSMNTNMHQVSLREKTLLKTYLEVDMNEFFQQKIDSEIFEGLDEAEKARFVGNFFHWVKCRFSDCSLLQTKSKINTHKKSEEKQPTIDETNRREAKNDLDAWGKNGANASSHNKKDSSYAQTKTVAGQPTIDETNTRENKNDLNDWATGKGHHTSSYNGKDQSYVQTKVQEAVKDAAK